MSLMGRIGPGVRIGVTYGSDWARSADWCHLWVGFGQECGLVSLMGRIGPGVRVDVTYGLDWARSAG